MIKILIEHKEQAERLKLEIGDSMTIQEVMQYLRNKKIIDLCKPYYLRTKENNIYPPTKKFNEFKEREFDLIQDSPPPAKAFNQLGIFVIDGSASMKEGLLPDKTLPSDAVNKAVQNSIKRFKNSSKKNCYSFAVVAFGDEAKTIQKPENVTNIDDQKSFEPTGFFNNGDGSKSTNIAAGLFIANDLANEFLKNKEGTLIHKVMIVLLSDGMCHHANETRAIAEELKKTPNVEINSCHLETNLVEDGAAELLKSISNRYETVYTEGTIRDCFISSVSMNRG
jgi:uncharacterized protein YegL